MSSEPIIDDPEVVVDDLLRRVRQEVERRRLGVRVHGDAAPPPVADDQVAAAWQAMNEAIAAADASATVGMRLPPMTQLQGLKRRIAVPVARVILRAAQLVTRDQTAFNRLVLELVRMLMGTIHDRLSATAGKIDVLTDGVVQALAQSRAVSDLLDAGARAASEIRALREGVGGLEDRCARLDAAIAELARVTDESRRAEKARAAEAERLRAEQARTLAFLERRVATLVERPSVPPPPGGPAPAASEAGAPRLPDAFYVDFEDRFRGSRAEVKRRMHVYLPIVTEAGAGSAERPVLDVGCGRGEWLEVLREQGLVGRGIDVNAAMVTESRNLGLDVVEADALAHLRSLPDASLGAVTAMHVIEHIPFATLVEVLDECTRVLRPGGVAIFETPNPKNLLVGACQFYVDPTHRRPLHPDAMAFVAEQRGFTRVRILPLHPVDGARPVADTEPPVVRLLNDLLFGPQDFALVGYRA